MNYCRPAKANGPDPVGASGLLRVGGCEWCLASDSRDDMTWDECYDGVGSEGVLV